MSQHYSDPSRASDPWTLPDVETFHLSAEDFYSSWRKQDGTWMSDLVAESADDRRLETMPEREAAAREASESLAGWYWWTCIPGCMPDSDPFGPFDTEEKAVEAAQADNE